MLKKGFCADCGKRFGPIDQSGVRTWLYGKISFGYAGPGRYLEGLPANVKVTGWPDITV